MDSAAFLRQVGSIPLLSPSQEVELALRMRVGKQAALRLAVGGVEDQRPGTGQTEGF